jgi:hypothetical protein
MMVAVGMTTPQPAAAACWYDPSCLVDAVLDPIFDTVKGVLKLTWNVITLDPEDAWEDLKEVGYNQICGPGLSVFTMAVANGLEEDFDECASPPHPIELDVLEKLQLYIKSPLDTVHIHEGCNLNADVIPGDDSSHRNAITFGEHIYFEPGEYHPQDDHGFALLAHELTHVLQYRQKGFADFTCQYATHCAFGLYQGCEIEESAYDYQDLVLQDRQADSDGVFPPTDNCPNVPNPDQADANSDGRGDACDPSMNPRLLADVNGDGKQDIVAFWDDGVYVSLSTGSGFTQPTRWIDNFSYNNGGWRVDKHLRLLADVNGDGKADVVGFGDAGVYMALSEGAHFGQVTFALADFGIDSGWRVDAHPRVLADVNSDGKQDIVGFGDAGVYMALSEGAHFGQVTFALADFGYDTDWR